ncbi:Ig-like domain (group 3) [Parafrankia irregularis]|uniref:Ig-like domain (Group 3) n=1 Tax=Parafrankia irregularis TaxID=795642 RepID=A0A0S4QHV4_9ACTN|nr:Ig-like domain repeat protein [Parafrankia sp. CH37]MBE3203261.1 Ig-like domain repeat protein [Parafrankia sp. CH37]CUU54090.1 Ig-like domain (group 3) [Parafrankia irregularis]
MTVGAAHVPDGEGIWVEVVPVSDRSSLLPAATGTVTVHEGDKLLGTVTIEKKGSDPFATGELDVDLPPGYHSLTLDYGGDVNYQPNRATTPVNTPNVEVIASAPGSFVDGQSYTIEVQVVPVAGITGTPTGRIRNTENLALPPFEAALDSQGRATITIPEKPARPYITEPSQGHVYIEYTGDSTFVPNRAMILFTVLPSTAG